MKDIKHENYVVLLEQRRQIINEIDGNKKSFHTAIFSILTFISANLITAIFANEKIPFVFVFLAFQVVLALACYVIGLLLAMNNDRDFIRAIDNYIEEVYGVDALFFQGELHYRIINKKSNFTYVTTLSGGIIFCSLAVVGIIYFEEIVQLIVQYFPFGVLLIVELIGILIIIFRNYRYKKTGKSKIREDCYEFLYRNRKNSFNTKDTGSEVVTEYTSCNQLKGKKIPSISAVESAATGEPEEE